MGKGRLEARGYFILYTSCVNIWYTRLSCELNLKMPHKDLSYKKSTWMDGSPVSAEGLADRMDHFCGAGEGGCLVPQSDHELWSQTSHPTSIYL